jgi:cell fate regulator YaaT (PSP1 superfamily)
MAIQLDLMPLEEKMPESPAPKTIVVRYGFLKEIGEFPSDLTSKVGCGSKLIVRTDRGTEIAEMLTTVCGNGGCSKSITRDKLLDYIDKSGGKDYPFSENGRVLRSATVQDLAEQSKLDEQRGKHIAFARELVHRHQLAMKIVDVEYLLGGERVLFYFTSEQRIDFRLLVRDLAHEMHARIELRQVGARDEARLTADYEKCGQHCCCKQFLKVLTPISMRAAKTQKATLDPTKISGRCGRLMCCLRYEDQTYEELRKKLPKRNTRVATADKGDGWVIDGQILTQLVLVQFDDGKREAVPMEKITGFDRPKPLMSDGRVMQTPNDRPLGAVDGPPVGGPGGRPPRAGPPVVRRPMPGAPLQGPVVDPLARDGATGGDLNVDPRAEVDELDDLIADAMDGAVSPPMAGPGGAVPPVAPPMPPRPPQGGQRPPQQNGPRPPQQGRGGPGQRPPQQGRGPQGFRPPQQQQRPPVPPVQKPEGGAQQNPPVAPPEGPPPENSLGQQ